MDYEILRKLSKAEYVKLRGKVRANILINSRLAESKRRFFYEPILGEPRKPMIVGGLVLKREVTYGCSLY